MTRACLLAATLAFTVAACSSSPGTNDIEPNAGMTTITGSFTYRERIALPSGALGIVKLSDVSRADAVALVLAEEVIDLDGRSVPIDYTLRVPTPDIAANLSYAVRAEIRGADGSLMWTTDTIHPIDPAAGDQTMAPITLIRIGGRPSAPGDDALTSGVWRVEDIDGGGVIDYSQTTLNFSPDGTLSGRAGCNSYTGSYELEDGVLTLGSIALTRKACVPALGDQESKFISVLNDVERLSFGAEGALTLETPDGRYLLARKS